MFRRTSNLAYAATAATSARAEIRHENISSGNPAAYVSRIRRAFLLRVHPDRFRSQPDHVRKEQANLVQALSDRLNDPDFLQFTSRANISTFSNNLQSKQPECMCPYSIEAVDGTIVRKTIHLDANPYQILKSMADTINFPPPPTSMPSSHQKNGAASRMNNGNKYSYDNIRNGMDQLSRDAVDHFLRSSVSNGWGANFGNVYKSSSNSHQSLIQFLKQIDPNDVKKTKFNRLHANAAALVARRAFHFSSVDGTGLGWSSYSLKMCISRLTSLHDEHQMKLRIKSFYPFRLVFSTDEVQSKVDLYGGIIRLHPAATSLQWLEILLSVTDDSIRTLKQNQACLKEYVSLVEDNIGLKVKKGHTCDAEEYHKCIMRLGDKFLLTHGAVTHSSSLTVSTRGASLVIEAEQACRRGKLREDGNFQVGAGMSMDEILRTVVRFSDRSNERIQMELQNKADSKSAMERVLYEFGVQHVKAGSVIVNSEQMSHCMTTLLDMEEDEKETIRKFLAGQSIGVTGRGQPYHLGDDGSVMIPWDFSC